MNIPNLQLKFLKYFRVKIAEAYLGPYDEVIWGKLGDSLKFFHKKPPL